MATIVIDVSDEGPKKRQIIESAFGRLGMAGYEFGRTPEEINAALILLNDLMAEWPFSEIATYEQPDYGNGSADQSSGIPRADVAAVVAKLALLLAPEMGATLSPEAKASLGRSVASLHSRYATVPSMPRRREPRGAGNKAAYPPFISEDVSPSSDYDPGDLAGLIG